MKPLPHTYTVELAGDAEEYAVVSSAGVPELRTAAPEDFDGPGDAWSPEHLLMAAIETCFMFTFRAIASASKVKFTSLRVCGQGVVDRKEGVTKFTEIILRPRLTIAAGTDRDRALRVIEKAEKACLVSASLSTPIWLEPEITAV
ncbi:MAG TPA: OsmC family protein [Candidatus Binataceae bacterium]|nr:OsmC family protein [Candidatus Binataceae bacterium]